MNKFLFCGISAVAFALAAESALAIPSPIAAPQVPVASAPITPTGASTSSTLPDHLAKIRWVNDFAGAMSAGTPDDCSHDATPAILAAKATLPAGGGVLAFKKTAGCYKMNLTIGSGWDGVTLQGPGTAKTAGTPATANYFTAYNTANDALAISDGTSVVSSVVIRDMLITGGNGTGAAKGILVQDGATNFRFDNVFANNFTSYVLKLYSSSSTYGGITFGNFAGGGFDNFYQGDTVLSDGENAGYVNAVGFNGTHLSGAGIGHVVRMIGATQLFMANVYIQGNDTASTVSLERTGTNGTLPTLYAPGLLLDNGLGSSAISFENSTSDFSGLAVPSVIVGGGGTAVGGTLYAVNSAITGSITASTNSLTVSGAASFWLGRTVVVAGAGTVASCACGSHPLVATVTGVSGTTVTLSANASTTVASAAVKVGDRNANFGVNDGGTIHGFGAIQLSGASNITGFNPQGLSGTLYHTDGSGVVLPWSGFSNVLDLGSGPLMIGQDDGYGATISTVTRSGTTVTVTFVSGNGGAAVGDYIVIKQEKVAAGINGTWLITGITGTTATYTSNVSGTVSSFTGSTVVSIYKPTSYVNGNYQLGGALYMRNAAGTWVSIMSQSPTNGNFTRSTPDGVGGNFIDICGSSTSAASGCWTQYSNGNVMATVSKAGGLGVGGFGPTLPQGQINQVGASKSIFHYANTYTVAGLPSPGAGNYADAIVTDALTPAYGVALTGGGGVTIKGFFNGSAWVAE